MAIGGDAVDCCAEQIDRSEASLGKAAAELPHSKWLLAVAEAEGVPAGVGGPAAVYYEGVTVDEGAFDWVGEESDGASDVIGRGESAHGNAGSNVLIGVAAAGLIGRVHFGFHPARADGVDANSVAAPLRSESTCQADEGRAWMSCKRSDRRLLPGRRWTKR